MKVPQRRPWRYRNPETVLAARALTGPVARSDAATFLGQIDQLQTLAPEKVPLVLALATSRQQARLGRLGEAQVALSRDLAGRIRLL